MKLKSKEAGIIFLAIILLLFFIGYFILGMRKEGINFGLKGLYGIGYEGIINLKQFIFFLNFLIVFIFFIALLLFAKWIIRKVKN